MHRMISSILLGLAMASPSRAGMVLFDPPSAMITPGTQSVSFEVSVSWETLPTIDTINVFVFADDGVSLDFTYAQSFVDSTTLPPPDPSGFFNPCPFFGCGLPSIGFGGNRLFPAAQTGWMSPLLIGTLTVATDQLLAQDQIRVFVDSQQEMYNFGAAFSVVQDNAFNQASLSGLATITVVPEPATVGLLLFLSLVVTQRKGRVTK